MSAEVGFIDGRPHFTAGSRGTSTILIVKGGCCGALEQQNFAASEIRCRADARRDVIAKVAALTREDSGDIIFNGYRGGEKKMAFVGLNVNREIGGNGRLAGRFHANSSGKKNFAAHAGLLAAQLGASGMGPQKNGRIFL